MKTLSLQFKGRQLGFTLIEVMVTLLILAVGLLGLAGMMGQSLRSNHDAQVRTQATFLAYDLIDRMRVNTDNANDYEGPDPAVACNPAVVTATNDRACWHDAVAAALPGGLAAVAENPPGSGQYDIGISWINRSSEADDPASWRTFTQSWTVVVN